MAAWVFSLGAGIGDITSLVDVQSIVRTKRLFSEMKPNVNRLDFRMQFSASVWGALVSSSSVAISVTKDGVAYFTGVLSPNYETTITDGRKFVSVIAEDFTLSKLGKLIATTTTYASYAVCTPAATSTSLVHAIATAAGISLAAGLPTISSTIPYVCVLPDDKATYGDILAGILFEYGYCYSFLDDGTLTIFRTVNVGTVTPTSTFLVSGTTGNVRGQIIARKHPEKYDDIRVAFDTVLLKTGITIFEDTTGGDSVNRCNISLAATGDSEGKDYYPVGSGALEVYSEWRSPDGFKIWIATSAALDATVGGSITLSSALTNYFRRASFAYRNPAAAPASITKLRILGDAYVITSQNVARSAPSGGSVLYEHRARYVFATAAAQALANAIAQYYAYSDFSYELKCSDSFDLGAYVTLSDSVYLGISQKCRIIGKTNTESTNAITYALEAVADYVAISPTVDGVAAADNRGPQGLAGTQGPPGAAGGSTTWSGSSTEFPLNPSDNQAAYITSLKRSYVFANNGVTPTVFNTSTVFNTTTLFQGGSWYQMTQDGTDGANGANGTNGADGVGVVKSVVFKRNATQPATPSGGSWSALTPSGWSDGIPADNGQPLWMSTRVFTEDGNDPQQNAWTTPEKIGAPPQGTKLQWSANGSSWHDTPEATDIYMRYLETTDGGLSYNVVGSPLLVKGEQGDPPDPATLPRYLGAVSALPGSANWGDSCLLYTPLATRGLYVYDGAAWQKQAAPTTELISAAWPDICKAVLNAGSGGFVGGPFGTVPDYVGSGVNFLEVMAVQTAFIDKLFANVITLLTGGEIKSANYVAGAAGTRITSDGFAEFGNLTARGNFTGQVSTNQLVFQSVTAGGNVVRADNAEVASINDISYDKVKELQFCASGTIRVSFQLKSSSGSSRAFGRVYKNGIAVGTPQETLSTSYITFSESISGVVEGDLIQLWISTQTRLNRIYARNFSISVAEAPGILKYIGNP